MLSLKISEVRYIWFTEYRNSEMNNLKLSYDRFKARGCYRKNKLYTIAICYMIYGTVAEQHPG